MLPLKKKLIFNNHTLLWVRINRIILILLICFGFILINNSSLFAQNNSSETLNKHFSVSLLSEDFLNTELFDFKWINNNTLLYKDRRQLKMIKNVSSEYPEVVNITNFLMVEDDGNIAPYYYIPESDLIIFAEEFPTPTITMYNGKGQFIDYLVLDMEKHQFKLDYIEPMKCFLLLVDGKLLLGDNRNNFEILQTEVESYTYKENADEILVFKNKSKSTVSPNRSNYNLTIINIKDKHNAKLLSEKVMYANYYPSSNMLYYSTPITEDTCKITFINYKEENDSINLEKEIINIEDVIYENILNYRRNENDKFINKRILRNRPQLEYIPSTQTYIFIKQENETNTKTLNLLDKSGDPLFKATNNILDFLYNKETNDIILFYSSSNNKFTKIEHHNMNKWINSNNISNTVLNYENFFVWNKNLNIISYIEDNDGTTDVVIYSLIDKKEIIRKNHVKTANNVFIDIVSDELITTSYKTIDDVNITYFNNIKTGKTEEFEGSYYAKPCSEDTIAVVEKTNEVLKVNIYVRGAEGETGTKFDFSTLNMLTVGIKGSGLVTFLTPGIEAINSGYEIALFFNFSILSFLRAELDVIYSQRQFTFDLNYVSGEDPLLVSSIAVCSNMFSIQLTCSYMFSINRNIDIYIPLGVRLNMNIRDVLRKNLVTGQSSLEDFGNEMNKINFDIISGCGVILFKTERTRLFIELAVYFLMIPAFKESYLIENIKIYDYPLAPFGLQLNIGFSFFNM